MLWQVTQYLLTRARFRATKAAAVLEALAGSSAALSDPLQKATAISGEIKISGEINTFVLVQRAACIINSGYLDWVDLDCPVWLYNARAKLVTAEKSLIGCGEQWK